MNRHATRIIGAIWLAGLSVCLLAGCQEPGPSKRSLVDAGNRYFWRAQYSQATTEYKAALKRDPADADVLYKLGECYDYLGDYREAVYYYRRAVKSKGEHPEATRALEAAQRKLAGQPDLGLDQMNPRERAARLIDRAKTYEHENMPDKALENFKLAAGIAPESAYAHAELGRYYQRAGRNLEAVGELQRALQLNRNEPGVADDLAGLGVK